MNFRQKAATFAIAKCIRCAFASQGLPATASQVCQHIGEDERCTLTLQVTWLPCDCPKRVELGRNA
jgi:hypothetical protein